MSRQVHKEGRNPLLFWTGICALAGGVLLLAGAWQNYREHSIYAREGVSTQGLVVRKWFERAEWNVNPRSKYFIEYEFQSPGGASARNQAEIDPERWEVLAEGDSIRVVYLRQEPWVNFLEGAQPRPAHLPMAAAALALALAGGLACWASRRRPSGERASVSA